MKKNKDSYRITTTKPEIYKRLHIAFGVDWEKGIIIANGDTLHSKNPISTQKVVHELTHLKQQEQWGIDKWWKKYLDDKVFRLYQEAEAYGEEVKWIKKHIKDRNQKFNLILQLQKDMSSPMYGRMCTFTEAQKIIPAV